MPPPPSSVRFGAFAFDAATGELWRDDRRVPLQPQPSRLLALLLARPGALVGRDEIRSALWGDTHVDFERSLNFCVARLRAALEDTADAPQFVETIPTRGYRFIAQVAERGSGNDERQSANEARAPMLLIIGVALAVAAVVALRAYVELRPSPKVVVVPFQNDTGVPDLDRVAKGVSDATVARLAATDRVRVIGNPSGVSFSFRPANMKAIGESLGAQYLVLGQMKKDDRQMRIVAHLIRVTDQTHVWAKTYDSVTLDLPRQAVIAAEIAASVVQRVGQH